MRRARIMAMAAVTATALAGCGGGEVAGRGLQKALTSGAGRAAEKAAASRTIRLSEDAAHAAVVGAEQQQAESTVRSMATWVLDARERLEPVCFQIARAKFRYDTTDQQLYTLLTSGAKAVTELAAFIDVGRAVYSLSQGDIDDLWDAWCI